VRPDRLQSLVLSAAELALRQLSQLPIAAVSDARNIASGSNGRPSAAAPAVAAASSMGSAAAEGPSKTFFVSAVSPARVFEGLCEQGKARLPAFRPSVTLTGAVGAGKSSAL
jgi:hypothetical protein